MESEILVKAARDIAKSDGFCTFIKHFSERGETTSRDGAMPTAARGADTEDGTETTAVTPSRGGAMPAAGTNSGALPTAGAAPGAVPGAGGRDTQGAGERDATDPRDETHGGDNLPRWRTAER